jgi:hypothetical protein
VLLAGLLLAGCGKEMSPSREQIPVLRNRIARLQTAVAERDPVLLDSLMAGRPDKRAVLMDSLLTLVYRPDGSFAFERFGDYEIFYTRHAAIIDCFIMDSTAAKHRPLKLTFVYDNGRWLLNEFAPGRSREP